MPWLTSDQYFKRRPVATPSEERIRVYRAQWLDRENPGGGLSTDIASMMRDMGAQDADLAAGTTSQPGGGSHLHVGQHEVPAMELRTTVDQNCNGPTCSALINLTSDHGHRYSHLLRPGVERRDVLRQHPGHRGAAGDGGGR